MQNLGMMLEKILRTYLPLYTTFLQKGLTEIALINHSLDCMF